MGRQRLREERERRRRLSAVASAFAEANAANYPTPEALLAATKRYCAGEDRQPGDGNESFILSFIIGPIIAAILQAIVFKIWNRANAGRAAPGTPGAGSL